MSLPAAHPDVDRKTGKACPVTGKTHDYQPPTAGDVRSVCPAINAMANHGYIPRDGKGISPAMIFNGLRACYGLSVPLAVVLTTGGWLLIKRFTFGRVNLFELGLHNGVEHDASVVHLNCPPGQKDAPIEIQSDLVDEFVASVVEPASAAAGRELPEADVVVTGHDIVRTRIRREKLSKPLDAVHAEIARGEMAIILGVWNKTVDGNEGIPLPWMRTWLAEERLPEGWRPDHVQTLRDVVKRSSAMRAEMKKIRDDEMAAAKQQ
ncbi:Chloroperoxidase [Mycena maculata]|uniref:Chloroperoxidase n=1 Tax=Mycena maculata TaxID=230809 RepID=A0AAD7IP04_9AGAR|nr:Chloroperoxidase [Mycena maculata]